MKAGISSSAIFEGQLQPEADPSFGGRWRTKMTTDIF